MRSLKDLAKAGNRLYGNWKVAWSSNPSFQPFWNPEMDYSPRVPVSEDGRQINNDLCTWNTACKDESETYSIFVYDTEREPGSFVFDWRGNGALSEERSTWELMAWGHDTANIGYILIYEHGSPQVETDSGFAAVHIEAREWGHPTAATKAELLEAVKAFEDQKLTKLANEVMELKHDDRRVGALPFACYDECMNNTNTAEHWKRTVEKAVECPRWTHDEL